MGDKPKRSGYPHGYISPFDGKMWNADTLQWQAPTPEALASAAAGNEILWRITTLPTLPGYRIVRTLGVVSELTAASGWTAGVKGRDALAKSMSGLLEQAKAVGANAVVGLTSSSFGAGGGITSVLGGDAVGVLLIGTAALVEPVESAAEAPE